MQFVGTTWRFNETVSGYSGPGLEVGFGGHDGEVEIDIMTCNGVQCYSASINNGVLVYGIVGNDTEVYKNNEWVDDDYRTITFINDPIYFLPDEATATEWLRENAEIIIPEKLLDLQGAKILYDDLRDRFDGKAENVNPEFRSSISMGRASNSAIGTNSTAVGQGVRADGSYSHAEGLNSGALGQASHAEGDGSTASGNYSHAEGHTTTHGMYAHAEGENSIANGRASHAEGENTSTSENARGAHAEGYHSAANGRYSHAEGYYTVAVGACSSVFGKYNVLDTINFNEWPEWTNTESYLVGDKVRITTEEYRDGFVYVTIDLYVCKTANSDQEFTASHWINQEGKLTFAEIVGNGTSENNRSNARTLDWSGNESLAGSITLGKGTSDEVTLTAAQLKQLLALLT